MLIPLLNIITIQYAVKVLRTLICVFFHFSQISPQIPKLFIDTFIGLQIQLPKNLQTFKEIVPNIANIVVLQRNVVQLSIPRQIEIQNLKFIPRQLQVLQTIEAFESVPG